MKKYILCALVCGICIAASGQIEVSNKVIEKADRWVVTPNNMKGTMGRITFDNPPGNVWTIYVYTMADGKYVTSYAESNNKGEILLSPGEYKITLNDAPVQNIPVKKGHDTHIKVGLLEIDINDVWYLYDEAKTVSYTSGNKPEKLLLPIGGYQLNKGNSYTKVFVTEEKVRRDPGILETTQWKAIPVETKMGSSILKDETGILNLDFVNADDHVKIKVSNKDGSFSKTVEPGSTVKQLMVKPGPYDISWLGASVVYENVKVLAGYETSLKHSIFIVQSECKYRMFINGNTLMRLGPRSFAVPIEARISICTGPQCNYGEGYDVPSGETRYSKVGYLEVVSSSFDLIDSWDDQCLSQQTPRKVTLSPGLYTVIVNGRTEQILVKPGETIRL